MRQATGNHRRRQVRDCQNEYRNERSLPAIGIGCLEIAQRNWAETSIYKHHLFGRIFALNAIQQNLQVHHPHIPRYHLVIAIKSCYHSFWRLFQLLTIYARSDYDLVDIQPIDESPADYGPACNRHINNLNDEHARMLTRFNKNQLCQLLTQFDFPVHCMVPLHGD